MEPNSLALKRPKDQTNSEWCQQAEMHYTTAHISKCDSHEQLDNAEWSRVSRSSTLHRWNPARQVEVWTEQKIPNKRSKSLTLLFIGSTHEPLTPSRQEHHKGLFFSKLVPRLSAENVRKKHFSNVGLNCAVSAKDITVVRCTGPPENKEQEPEVGLQHQQTCKKHKQKRSSETRACSSYKLSRKTPTNKNICKLSGRSRSQQR